MNSRHTLRFSIIGAAALALCLPALAVAQQGRYPDWRYPQSSRNRDDDRYRRYDERYLKDSIQRLDRLAKDFRRDLDSQLDHSRQDGTRREDNLNAEARQFRNAVGDLKGRFGNGRDLSRSADEARRVLQIANNLERSAGRLLYTGRAGSEWSQIRQELRVISDAYGGYGYDDYRNSRRDDDYRNDRRDDDYRRRNPINDDWWRRIPWPN